MKMSYFNGVLETNLLKHKLGVCILGVAIMVILLSCSKSVIVELPPKMDLKAFQNIGVIEFSSNAEDKLRLHATQKFMQSIQHAQPGVRILELGDREQVLRSLGLAELDLEAIKAIGKKYGVHAVMTGLLEVSEIKPNIQLSQSFTSLSAKAYVNGSLSAKLWESAHGATVWTNSSNGKWSVANFSLSSGGQPAFGVSDPEEKYGKMVAQLVNALTADFRPRYEERVVED